MKKNTIMFVASLVLFYSLSTAIGTYASGSTTYLESVYYSSHILLSGVVAAGVLSTLISRKWGSR